MWNRIAIWIHILGGCAMKTIMCAMVAMVAADLVTWVAWWIVGTVGGVVW